MGHCVFDTLNGLILNSSDWLDYGEPGSSRLSDLQIKNCLFRNVNLNAYVNWIDELIVMYVSAGMNWRNCIQMHGVTIQDATRDATELYCELGGGISPVGRKSLDWLLTNEPANFSNITVQTGELFSGARPAASYDLEADEIPTYYTPNVTGNGVHLTKVSSSDSGSGTSLIVDDANWFTDPRYPTGETTQIHCEGANRTYTALNKATKTFTMTAGFTRTPGTSVVNRSITSGSTPNRGAVR
jgi:hypothetical protein